MQLLMMHCYNLFLRGKTFFNKNTYTCDVKTKYNEKHRINDWYFTG